MGECKILILAITFFSVTSDAAVRLKAEEWQIEDQNQFNDSVIISDNIPFYYLEYTYGKYMKTDRNTGLIAPLATIRNYSNKTNHLGTYFLNLLIIPDYDMYKKLGPVNLSTMQSELWGAVDKYFQKLTNPKIKLTISGVVLPTRDDIFDKPKVEDGEKYYISNNTLYNISKWLKDNEDKFEDLKYDAFVYMTSWPLKHYDEDRRKYVQDNSMTNPFVCNYKNNKNSQETKPPGGIFYYNTDRSKFGINNIYGTHFIAQGFSVPFDQDVGCQGGYVMDNWERNYDSFWSACSLSAFQSIKRNVSYSCLELTRESMHKDDDYDD